MIPKIIHYCWLSDETIPEDLQKYVDGWRKKLPEYKFIKWDFSRFDIDSSVWVKEAFELKKYAFACDYIRIYAVYNYGGIYILGGEIYNKSICDMSLYQTEMNFTKRVKRIIYR